MRIAPLQSPWFGLAIGTTAGTIVAAFELVVYALVAPYPEVLAAPGNSLTDAVSALFGMRSWHLLLLPVLALQFAAGAVWLLRDTLDRAGHARESLWWTLRSWRIPAYGALAVGAYLVVQDSYAAFRLDMVVPMSAAGYVALAAFPLMVPLFAWQHRVLSAPHPTAWWRPGWPGLTAVLGYLACMTVDVAFEAGVERVLAASGGSAALVACGTSIVLACSFVLQLVQARLWLVQHVPIRTRLAGAFDMRVLATAGWWTLAAAVLAAPAVAVLVLSKALAIHLLPQIEASRAASNLSEAWWVDVLSNLPAGALAWIVMIGSLLAALSYGRMVIRSAGIDVPSMRPTQGCRSPARRH